MVQKLTYLQETPSQTAGPYVHIGFAPRATGIEIYNKDLGFDIAGPNAEGERIRVEGHIKDGIGAKVKDALIEVWQANSKGNYAGSDSAVEEGFRGWGRAVTDFETGLWRFETIKPGQTPAPNGRVQAPHINLWIVARGINLGLNTRLYFDDEEPANAADPTLNLIEQEERRASLLATRIIQSDAVVYNFDITLQGEGETVFFDI
ncbi:protocatechuate 3,4-dioxygenase subunit alpha [Shimia sp. R9_2]|uniref:protocatechuate 3,4-dioxygenase subunit alpha n=1 Tax=Shimia sp. R9_2 TaxID=2821112 RepID=UPI001ADA9E76|nr:protocatechuate 3,4-dioxygenase subunit alpha [Shimia sp. R9_2]MBO9398651.1 protocatechuate 3,4-dioxygenase subunit alpha [Shimia sp. R9_2]